MSQASPPPHADVVVGEFTHQAKAFDRAPVMSSAETLGVLVELVREIGGRRWLDAACGSGIVARAVAAEVDEVLGVDMTAAMLDVAWQEARAAGLSNVVFELGDVTALGFPEGSFDGTVTRFSLHHIPAPGRVVRELSRVVRPGGCVILADHVADDDAAAAAWHQEIERLRDPSHWSCLTPGRIRALGEAAGLELEDERLIPFGLDFDEWLARSTGGPGATELISSCLADRPARASAFKVTDTEAGCRLELEYSLTRWRRPLSASRKQRSI